MVLETDLCLNDAALEGFLLALGEVKIGGVNSPSKQSKFPTLVAALALFQMDWSGLSSSNGSMLNCSSCNFTHVLLLGPVSS